MAHGGTIGHRLDKWLDECKMAFSGILLATREWRFDVTFVIVFVAFGTLMSLLSGSAGALNLFWVVDLGGKFKLLGESFLALFGINRNFWDWLLIFGLTLLQSILIGLVVLVWQKRRHNRKTQVVAVAKNANNVQDAGLAAGLAILGSGCPTCGTTLLAPVISTFVSSGSYMLAGVISGALTVAAVILALFAVKRVGRDAYAMIVSERFMRRHQSSTKQENQNG